MTTQEEIKRAKELAEGYSNKCRHLHQMIAEKWENQVLVVNLRTDLRFYEGMLQTCQAAVQMMERHLSGVQDGEPTIIVPWLSEMVTGLGAPELADWREKGGAHV